MIIKCKMCGGDIEFTPGSTYGTCEYCGSTSTIPKADDEGKLNLFNRANHFRRQNEFDKALTAYERLLEQDDTDAEAHWGAVISRFGIEYVEDPATGKRIPTCHRVQLTSILADADYKAALEYAPDTECRRLYEEEAARIAEIQKGILAISQNEKPYDVFICYKETDEQGKRTHDSQWAQDVYYGLTEQGYKVFFSRITLEDKLGQEYEPYIFAALNSAKVMVVIGSRPEYFNAVWVKNEWSRFLALMAKDRKRLLIPCYRDMDPYDLPDELSSLQSQDMSKIGFMQDLIRGVKKVLDAEKKPEQPRGAGQAAQPTAAAGMAPGISSLMERAYLFLEDGDFDSASEYLDRVLDIDPKYAPAYAAKVCVAYGLHREDDLGKASFQYEDSSDWQKALRFADARQKVIYEGYAAKTRERVTRQIRDYTYDCAVEIAVNPEADRIQIETELSDYRKSCIHPDGKCPDSNRRPGSEKNKVLFENAVDNNEPGDVTEEGWKAAAKMLSSIGDADAEAAASRCLLLAEQARQKAVYKQAEKIYKDSWRASGKEKAAGIFRSIPKYMDSEERARSCMEEAESYRNDLYNSVIYAIQQAGTSSYKWDLVKKQLADAELDHYRDIDQQRIKAEQMFQKALEGEKIAQEQEKNRVEQEKANAVAMQKRKNIICIAALLVSAAVLYVVFWIIIPGNNYNNAVTLRQSGKYDEAAEAFTSLGNFRDAAIQVLETKYQKAQNYYQKGDYLEAYQIFRQIRGYKNVDSLFKEDAYLQAGRREAFSTIGSTVFFGHYEQDNNTENGMEEIEWIVLDTREDKSLLLSKKVLSKETFNYYSTNKYSYWDNSTLRTWLNDKFINTAFNEEETSAILMTEVDNSKQQGFQEYRDSYLHYDSTTDRMFLLSYYEAFKLYFKNDSERKAGSEWWLRSPGKESDSSLGEKEIAYVTFSGGLSSQYGGDSYSRSDYGKSGVRPAFWIDLNNLP